MAGLGKTATIEIETGATTGDTITSDLFGANILYQADLVDGTFGQKVESLGVSHIRFPGGGVTERDFDPTDPDARPVEAWEDWTTLTEFLAFCKETGHKPVLVLPTKRYVDDIERGIAEIGEYVARVTSGEFGDVEIAAFEIGNEYQTDITAAEYAEVASALVPVVAANAAPGTDISVQRGRSVDDAETIVAAFDTPEKMDAVTMLSFHALPWRQEKVSVDAENDAVQVWKDAGVGDVDTYLSEWNLGSHKDASTDDRHDYGMPQLAVMLEIITQAAESGVDMASVWAIQQTNKTSMAQAEGNPIVFAAGHLFRMMSESLPGSQVVSYDAGAAEGFDIFAFESDTDVTLFVQAPDFDGEAGPITAEISLDGAGVSHAWVDTLETWQDPEAPRPMASLDHYRAEIEEGDGGPVVRVTFEDGYGLARIVMSKTGSRAEGESFDGSAGADEIVAGAGHDRLDGSKGGDLLDGMGGHDVLIGGRGTDTLGGGDGNDTLKGGGGRDELIGGDGHDNLVAGGGRDLLSGGAGNDDLFGGKGNDELDGGTGADWLIGGKGNDVLTGGAGHDRFIFTKGFGSDVITDFEHGVDKIIFEDELGLRGYRQVANRFMEEDGDDLVISLRGGDTLRIEDVSLGEIWAVDFSFG
ncbi:MAG: calcium-binding protein [Pseudomonadota bacterium]